MALTRGVEGDNCLPEKNWKGNLPFDILYKLNYFLKKIILTYYRICVTFVWTRKFIQVQLLYRNKIYPRHRLYSRSSGLCRRQKRRGNLAWIEPRWWIAAVACYITLLYNVSNLDSKKMYTYIRVVLIFQILFFLLIFLWQNPLDLLNHTESNLGKFRTEVLNPLWRGITVEIFLKRGNFIMFWV